jgi:leucyl-tRNA synthetase
MWERLGHKPCVALAGWLDVDPQLLVAQSIVCVVQISGKVKARIEVPVDISAADLEQLALADESVVKALGDTKVKQVIVVAPKLVNIVI